MAGAKLEVSANSAELGRLFEELLRRTESAAPAMKNIGEALLASHKARFSDQEAPDGTPWQENAPSTKAQKRNPKILQELGEQGGLLGTLAYEANDTGLELGTPKEYAAIQHFGGQAGRGLSVEIPSREFLGVSRDDEMEAGEILRDHILGF